MIEIQVTCTVCDGSGKEGWFTMGNADNMDVDWGTRECVECCGSGWELIEILQVVEA